MLACKNVFVNGRRTSMRFDQKAWEILSDICQRENMTIHQLCSEIDIQRKNVGLSRAVRLCMLNYLRQLLSQYKGAPPHKK